MAPPKFRKDQRSKGPGGSKPGRAKGSFKGAPPRGDFKGGPKGDFKGDRKGGAPRSEFKKKSDFQGNSRGFKGAPKGDGTRSDFKKNSDFQGSSKGFKGARPFRAPPPKTQDAPHPASDFGPRRPEHQARPANPGNWLYGLHAVQAALANPRRKLGRLVLTRRAAEILGEERPDRVRVEIMEPGAIDKLLPPGAVHQGAALETKPLPATDLDTLLSGNSDGRRRIVLVLDQLTDPHNVGAILRSAVAFGVTAVVVQDRHAPPQSGVLAKAASGALDLVPYIEVVNITRALEKLAEHGFWRIALAGDGAESLQAAIPAGDVALVLGSEGDGIRRLVREHCDTAALIPIEGAMESLNVSNAAAVALYELRRK